MTLLYKIKFRVNNLGGTFLANDIVECFFDDTILATVVKKNGVIITDGPYIRNFDVLFKDTNWQQCVGTTLYKYVDGRSQFPYAHARAFSNQASCGYYVCDLNIIGIPNVTNASSSTTPDGSINVLANSSELIRYNLNTDFAYEDETGQNHGLFTNLLPGSYKIYIRDYRNCSANIDVVVSAVSSYATIYRLMYTDRLKNRTILDIQKKGYVGPVIDEVCGSGNPLIIRLRGEGETNKFYPVLSVQAEVSFISIVDFQWSVLYTNSDKDLKLIYAKNVSGNTTEYLELFILKNQYSEPYIEAPYPVNFVATDNLALLKEFPFSTPEGGIYRGLMSQIKLVAKCLKETGLSLPIRVACNLYAEAMDQTDTDDPLAQANEELYKYFLNNEPTNVSDVLKNILLPYGARILQYNKTWNIERVEEKVGDYDYRLFDANGDFVSNGTANDVIEIGHKFGSFINWINVSQQMQIIPGFGKIRCSYDLGLLNNIIANGDFTLKPIADFENAQLIVDTFGFQFIHPNHAISTQYDVIDANNVALILASPYPVVDGTSYIESVPYFTKTLDQLKVVFRVKIPQPVSNRGYNVPMRYIKIRVSISFGTYYLGADGHWNDGIYTELTWYYSDFDKYQEYSIITSPPDGGDVGADLKFRMYQPYIGHANYTSNTELKAAPTINLPLNTKAEVSDPGPLVFYYELVQTTDTSQTLIEPDDYDSTTNPVKWEFKERSRFLLVFNGLAGALDVVSSFFIDHLTVSILDNGNDPPDVAILEKNAEPGNFDTFEETLYNGSFSEDILSLPREKIGLYKKVSLTPVNYHILAADRVYYSFLRDSNNIGYTTFKRDNVAESTTLQNIFMAMYAAQYNRPFKKLTGTLGGNLYASLLSCFKNNIDGKKYIPVSIAINDWECSYEVELLELTDINESGGSDGSGSSPFSSAFTNGFGSSGFN